MAGKRKSTQMGPLPAIDVCAAPNAIPPHHHAAPKAAPPPAPPPTDVDLDAALAGTLDKFLPKGES